MNSVADIKKFVLRYVWAANGLPLPSKQLDQACLDAFTPRPLLSDVHDARRELERDGFIQGQKDDLDETETTWSLTSKGVHKAKAL